MTAHRLECGNCKLPLVGGADYCYACGWSLNDGQEAKKLQVEWYHASNGRAYWTRLINGLRFYEYGGRWHGLPESCALVGAPGADGRQHTAEVYWLKDEGRYYARLDGITVGLDGETKLFPFCEDALTFCRELMATLWGCETKPTYYETDGAWRGEISEATRIASMTRPRL